MCKSFEVNASDDISETQSIPDATLVARVTVRSLAIPPARVVSNTMHTSSCCPSVPTMVRLGKRISEKHKRYVM